MNDELQVIQPPSGGLSIEQAFQAVVAGTIKAEHVAVMRELLAMDAERKFNAAFVRLQSKMPVIVATTVIPKRGKYERFEDVMNVIGPLLSEHGFTVSFSQDFDEKRIIVTCTLSHEAGHSRPNSFAVRTAPSDTETQADCKAATTAKRNALCQALNIVIRQDVLNEEHDAGIEGDPNAKITPEEADALSKRVLSTKSNIQAFLKFCGAECFSEITRSRYVEADAQLRRKEKAALK